MQGERQGADPAGGVEHTGAVPAGGVHQELTGPHGTGPREPLDQPGQGVVGDGQQDQLGPLQYLRGRDDGHVGQQLGGAPTGRVGHTGDGDRAVSGEPEDAARAGPTRPAPTTPTVSLAGRGSAGGFTWRRPSVPVLGGYRTISRHATPAPHGRFRTVHRVPGPV